MLNEVQRKYIEDLRVTDPDIPNDELTDVLIGAGWPQLEVQEALIRYRSVGLGLPEKETTKEPEPFVVRPKPEPAPELKQTLPEGNKSHAVDVTHTRATDSQKSHVHQSSYASVPKTIAQETKRVGTDSETSVASGDKPSNQTDLQMKKPLEAGLGGQKSPDVVRTGEGSARVTTEKPNEMNSVNKHLAHTEPEPHLRGEEPHSEPPHPYAPHAEDQHVVLTGPERNVPTQVLVSSLHNHGGKGVGIAIGFVLFLIALGAVGYYGYTQFFPFGTTALTSNTILSHIVKKMSEVETANYTARMHFVVAPRDVGAQPFNMSGSISPEELAKYQRDQDRFRDVEHIMDELREVYDPDQYDYGYGYFDEEDRKTTTSASSMYPDSLFGLIPKLTDPLGVPYRYTRAPDGQSYTIEVTFETDDAVRVASGSWYSYDDPKLSSNTQSKTVTISGERYFSSYGFEGKPREPRLFGIFEMSEMEEIIPADMTAEFSIGGSMHTKEMTPLDAQFSFEGSVTMGDAYFEFGAEGIKKDNSYYGIVHKLPSFFSEMSQIREKWVMVTPADFEGYGYADLYSEIIPAVESEQNEKIDSVKTQARKLLEIADREGLVTVTSGPDQERVGTRLLSKYTVTLDREALIRFYTEAAKELEQYGEESIVPFDASAVEMLQGPDAEKAFAYLKDNQTFSLWFDAKGFLVQSEIRMRYVPSERALALKDKQLELIFTWTLDDINKRIEVTAPEGAITVDELMALLTGRPKEFIVNERQLDTVRRVRNALDAYERYTGGYPDTLDALTTSREELSKSTGMPPPPPEEFTRTPVGPYGDGDLSYLYDDTYFDRVGTGPFLARVPTDAYTKAFFIYQKNGDNYTLKYQMKLPPYTKDIHPSEFYTYRGSSGGEYFDYYSYEDDKTPRLLVPKHMDGENIATKDVVSQSEFDVVDSDGDILSDSLEKVLGTDPNNRDTDSDGYTDGEEIDDDSNPLGPGKIEAERWYGGMLGIF